MQQKVVEVTAKKKAVSIKTLQTFDFFNRKTHSAKAALSFGGVIAEHKRRSPSKAAINTQSKVQEMVAAYDIGGAAVLSILTDTVFFGGSLEDLITARNHTEKPLLRKDFIYDPYQIYEAKAYGADVILLIAAVLSKNKISELSALAHELGLEVLLEVHDKEELLQKQLPSIDLLGVNHRNLKTFEVSLDTSLELVDRIPNQVVKISESGISDPATLVAFRKAGFHGFLIGENFMKTSSPEQAAMDFIQEFRRLMGDQTIG
jgi:indole-3-glycerol phosphate synthase